MHVDSPRAMLEFLCVGRGDVAESVLKCNRSWLRYSEGSGREVVEGGSKNSPGSRSVVP